MKIFLIIFCFSFVQYHGQSDTCSIVVYREDVCKNGIASTCEYIDSSVIVLEQFVLKRKFCKLITKYNNPVILKFGSITEGLSSKLYYECQLTGYFINDFRRKRFEKLVKKGLIIRVDYELLEYDLIELDRVFFKAYINKVFTNHELKNIFAKYYDSSLGFKNFDFLLKELSLYKISDELSNAEKQFIHVAIIFGTPPAR